MDWGMILGEGLYDGGLWCRCRSWGICSVMIGCLNVSDNRFAARGAGMMAMNRSDLNFGKIMVGENDVGEDDVGWGML
ncbi:hypothetical protein Hanom_Chr09g00816381 [Helianthus anomalus]